MSLELFEYHRFLDEAGDTTFYGKGRIPILGENGVSNTFILGMLKINQPLEPLRKRIVDFCKVVQNNRYYKNVPSVVKRVSKGNFYLHAKDDLPEIRKEYYDFIQSVDCSYQAVVGRKIITLFEKKHNGKETEFYADLLSHLLKDKFSIDRSFVLNVAERANSTAINNLEKGLIKAENRFKNKYPNKDIVAKVSFSIQKYQNEPILSITDYLSWAVQRVFEKGETRFYDYMIDKISLVVDLYDDKSFMGSKNYYKKNYPLTEKNKVSPQSS